MLSHLIDGAAVAALSERLSKTSNLRLTPADVEFLTSHNGLAEDASLYLPLPAWIKDHTTILAFL